LDLLLREVKVCQWILKKKNFLRWRYSGRDNVGSRSEATMAADIVFGFSALALFH
jgi:hypothetical protein